MIHYVVFGIADVSPRRWGNGDRDLVADKDGPGCILL